MNSIAPLWRCLLAFKIPLSLELLPCVWCAVCARPGPVAYPLWIWNVSGVFRDLTKGAQIKYETIDREKKIRYYFRKEKKSFLLTVFFALFSFFHFSSCSFSFLFGFAAKWKVYVSGKGTRGGGEGAGFSLHTIFITVVLFWHKEWNMEYRIVFC